jgi:hypothetical protein
MDDYIKHGGFVKVFICEDGLQVGQSMLTPQYRRFLSNNRKHVDASSTCATAKTG